MRVNQRWQIWNHIRIYFIIFVISRLITINIKTNFMPIFKSYYNGKNARDKIYL